MVPVRPTLQAVVDQACRATGAACGWLLLVEPAGLRVAATAGAASGRGLEGSLVAATAVQRYALSSGQPAALLPPPGDPASVGAGGHPATPGALLVMPCGGDPVPAVLELADKRDGVPFDLDDLTRISILAAVAAAALTEHHDGAAAGEVAPPSPSVLSDALHQLARLDPARYRATARIVAAALAAGT